MSEQVDLTTIPISPDGDAANGSSSQEAPVEKPITVFHDKDNFNVKHPLANRWTLWFTKPASGKVRRRVQSKAAKDGGPCRFLTCAAH
jgi:translation initiation factor 4E